MSTTSKNPDAKFSFKKQERIALFDAAAGQRGRWKSKNRYYYRQLEKVLRYLSPTGHSLLEVGCGTGDFVAAIPSSRSLGIDVSPQMIARAKENHPGHRFQVGDIEKLELDETFDTVILSDLIGHLDDIWSAFENLQSVTTPESRIILTHFNHLWEPVLRWAERLGLMMRQDYQNWLSLDDLENLLRLTGFEVLRKEHHLLLPKWIPLVSYLANRFLAKLPGLRHLCLVQVIVARQQPKPVSENWSCSVIIPCRNELGNIEDCVRRTPVMGSKTELIFVDGNSTDGTVEKIHEFVGEKGKKSVSLILQGNGKGKADAVRKGFARATGDVLMILDADLTVDPEELPRFWEILTQRKGEMVMGSRLIYPMESQAMRTLNYFGNKTFSMMFTWLLEQHIKDTLCGTKVLTQANYKKIEAGRSYFGDFDPFGDFDLIFGAAKLNLKIVEIPIHYRDRTYGDTKISRWTHGWLLLKMCFFALRRLKFR